MDAVKFLKERKRMCKSFIGACDGCPLANSDCRSYDNADADAQVEAVEKWSKEHPVKTRMSEFLKQYPSAKLTADRVPNILPCDFDERLLTTGICSRISCLECSKKYWLEEIEGND